MTGIYADEADGTGESSVAPYYNEQDGNGEQQPSRVLVNKQDGNGEVVVWEATSYPLVIDDFEDGDTLEYSTDNGNWSLSNTTTLEGSWHIVESAGNFAHLRSYPGDGLDYYYGRSDGDALAYQFQMAGTGISVGVYFGAVDSNNTYFTRWASGDLELVEKVGGTNSVIASTPLSLSTGTEYRAELRWDDGNQGGAVGDMLLEIYNGSTLVGDVPGNSTNVESNTGSNGRGIGYWRTGNAVDVRMDYPRRIAW